MVITYVTLEVYNWILLMVITYVTLEVYNQLLAQFVCVHFVDIILATMFDCFTL